MTFTMASVLIHSDAVPESARDALKEAEHSPPPARRRFLESAARILHDEAGVECSDARELVDLQPGECSGGM
jgi:hypothetical protein